MAEGQATSDKPLRVWIADDSFLIRDGLKQLLSLAPQLCVTATFESAAALEQALHKDAPEVVITDIRMPPSWSDEGVALAERLRVNHPEIGVIVLSQHAQVDYAAKLLSEGSSGRAYLLKDRIHNLDQMVSTIQSVAAGDCRVDPQLVDEMLARNKQTRSPLDQLTPRQREILADVAEGKSNQLIAQQRCLTQRAVEKHVSEIFGRLGLISDPSLSRRVRATLIYLAEQD